MSETKKTTIKKEILEGSRAVALTIKNINPAVVSAYPITPQTHIVEDLAQIKADGQAKFEYLRAESEFAAASIVLGASAAGARVYSATSSQGLLLMTEVLYNISGMRLPVVMTCANRAISSPINIWNDHSDVMSIRDSGFIQLFASDLQEVVNQHILAYKIAEKTNLPVMVNMDGFILTHSYEPVVVPSKKLIKKFLPDYKPELGTYLNTKAPKTFGSFFSPDSYFESRQDLHNDLIKSADLIKKEYPLMIKALGFDNKDNGLFEYVGPRNPKVILLALGSVNGTILSAINSNKELKSKVALIKLKTYRPFPGKDLSKIIKSNTHVGVIEKALNLGQTGPLYSDLSEALNSNNKKVKSLKNYIVGLGGRDVTEKIIEKIIKDLPKKSKKLKFYT